MLTDTDLKKLHMDKNYKTSNSYFRLWSEIFGMIQNGGDFIEVSSDLSGQTQISVKFITLFWIFFRYFRIVKEVRYFRKQLIEALLSEWYVNAGNDMDILRECAMPNAIWLDLKSYEKLDYLERCCIEYINVAENRAIFSKYLKSDVPLFNLKKNIRVLFEEQRDRIKKKEVSDFYRSQLSDKTIKELAQSINSNLLYGNLTNNYKRIDKDGN